MKIISLSLVVLAAGCSTYATQPAPVEYATAGPAYVHTPAGYAPAQVVVVPASTYAMSQEELRQCIALDQAAKAGASEVAITNPDLERRRASIAEQRRMIEARRGYVDSRNPAAVDQFNRQVAEFAAFTADYNADTSRAQSRADTVNRTVADYNRLCAGRNYHLRDMDAVAGDRYRHLGGGS
ncbi:MAG TPA: hypothetical protein VM074_05540 [Solimonas sp.]|nr:hypothetical protein [Solimonas sp.]